MQDTKFDSYQESFIAHFTWQTSTCYRTHGTSRQVGCDEALQIEVKLSKLRDSSGDDEIPIAREELAYHVEYYPLLSFYYLLHSNNFKFVSKLTVNNENI